MDRIITLNSEVKFWALQEGIFCQSKSFLLKNFHIFYCKLIAYELTLSYEIGKSKKSSSIALDSFHFPGVVVEEWLFLNLKEKWTNKNIPEINMHGLS